MHVVHILAVAMAAFLPDGGSHTWCIQTDAHHTGGCVQLGVHRSSSVASSGIISNARGNSDSSDKLAEAAAAVKEMLVGSASYTEQTRAKRVRSAEMMPEFAPVREESVGEQSDVYSAATEGVDQRSWSSQDLSGATENVFSDKKLVELKLAERSDKPGGHGSIKTSGGRTTAHVGFVE